VVLRGKRVFARTAVSGHYNIQTMKKKIDIPAIHDKDLKEILQSLQLLDKFEQGEILCKNCMKTITCENLFALKVVDENIVAFCDEADCIENSND
jgi:hypothetical protein